jgi:hypothetical protein
VAQTKSEFDKYHTNKEIQQMLTKLKGKNIALHTIAESPGGNPITVLEIGANLEDVPAIFVGANFEGNVPLATEGALYLAQMLLDSTSYTQNVKWYIMPQPNPDAANGFFAQLKWGRNTNEFSVNDDADNATNEDGYEDLNGDGYITQMRVQDVEGEYITSTENDLFMKKADAEKGERGIYKLYSEGIDNDKDGKFNEDGIGGINVGIAFPHLFPRQKSEAGMYAGQTPEVYGIMRFIYDRPEIAMAFTLGSSNFCLVPPQGGRKGDANLESIKLSGRYARMLNADSGKKYSMDEVVELFKAASPAGTDISPQIVARRLSLGAAVNPLAADLTFYEVFSEQYKDFLKGKAFSTNTLKPCAAKDGSFELWAYYHLGVPSFSMNLFSVPKPASAEDEMEEASEKGKKQKDNKPSYEREKALLAYAEKEWEGKGMVEWQTVNHPTLGRVEVGGFIPYLETTPKPEKIANLAASQLPWLLQLTNKLPQLEIESQKVTRLGTGVYKIEVIISNNGALPYPIAMGERNNQPAPVIAILNGDFEILDGKTRTPLGSIKANQLKKLSWMVKTSGKAMQASVRLESTVFTDKVQQINIGG